MSMRGELISKEYNRMAFIRDNNGKEFVCYEKDVKNVKNGDALTKEQQDQCMDASQILGDTW